MSYNIGMSDILEALFGSRTRARLLRFFLLNPEQEYQSPEIIRRNMTRRPEALREIKNFKKIKFILGRTKKGKKFYILNINFPFYPELRNLVVKSNIYPQCASLGKIKHVGDVKLALISGVFLNYSKSKADMILVANSVNRRKLKNLINSIEAEIGKEISYVLMNSEELKYRMNMLDRFLMEFFEGPHDEIINKVPGLKRFISNLKR
jgi:hypothetical protein